MKKKKTVKWMKIRFVNPQTKVRHKSFWVSERNKYFEWYKKNPCYEVLKEVER